MITRHSPGSHICLSCQRSLAQRATRTTSRLQLPFTSTYSTTSFLRSLESNNSATDSRHKLNRRSTPIRKKEEFSRNEASRFVRPRRPLANQLSAHPLGKLYGYRGSKARAKTEDLKISSLGDDAKVIVLRESNLNYYNAGAPEEIEPEDVERVDILGKLAEERGVVGPKEVVENIDAFRPKPGEEPQDWYDINELVKDLQDGFMTSQLEMYVDAFQGKREPENPAKEWTARDDHELVLRITPWLPGISDQQDQFDNDPLRGYFMESHTTKQRIILRVLRECWMLELPEVSEGIGQFEIEVKQGDLDLLLNGSPSKLKSISDEYLASEEESLETFRSRGAIRVTTMRHKMDWVTQAIEQELQNIRRAKIYLGDLLPTYLKGLKGRKIDKWFDDNFNDAVLLDISRLTKTVIVRLPKNNILISCIENKPGTETSNRVDVARRLLTTSCRLSDRDEHWLECEGGIGSHGAFINYPLVEGLKWRERLLQWSRWTVPTSKEINREKERAIDEVSGDDNIIGSNRAGPWWMPEQLSSISDSSSTEAWSRIYHRQTSALIGSVLHSGQGSFPNESSVEKVDPIRSFSTSIPNLAQVLSKAQLRSPEKPYSYLTLRFLPNPFQIAKTSTGLDIATGLPHNSIRAIGSSAIAAFPPLEMRLSIDPDTKEAKLKVVQAIVYEEKFDIMLPDNGVDVRFEQKTTNRLCDTLTQIEDFIRKSRLSLVGGKLETPPNLTVPVDGALCRGEGLKLLGGDGEDVREVEYLFAGLDIRSTLVFDYKGWRLLYTSIEAGRAGGRRGELRLQPICNGEVKSGEEFLEMAHILAREVGGGSITKPSRDSIVRKLISGELPLFRRSVVGAEKERDAPHNLFKHLSQSVDSENKAAVADDKFQEFPEALWEDGFWEAEESTLSKVKGDFA